MADNTMQMGNQSLSGFATKFFNSQALIGAPSVVAPVGTLNSPPLNLIGMYNFVLFAQLNQAVGGTLTPQFRYLDPETLAPINGTSTDVFVFVPGGVAGSGANTFPKWFIASIVSGVNEIPISLRLEFVVTGAACTITNPRLLCNAAGV